MNYGIPFSHGPVPASYRVSRVTRRSPGRLVARSLGCFRVVFAYFHVCGGFGPEYPPIKPSVVHHSPYVLVVSALFPPKLPMNTTSDPSDPLYGAPLSVLKGVFVYQRYTAVIAPVILIHDFLLTLDDEVCLIFSY